jgi:hypothetical protein
MCKVTCVKSSTAWQGSCDICKILWKNYATLSSSKYDKENAMSVYGAKDIQIVKQDHILRTMEWSSTCPLCWVRCQVNPLQQARQYSTQHSWARVGSFHNIWGLGWQIQYIFYKNHVKQTFWSLFCECRIITRRLCHILWSRKWHNLPPQTLMH